MKTSGLTVSNTPKIPEPNDIYFGEIAINYKAGHETLAIKNSTGDVVTISSDNVRDEQVVHKESAETINGSKTFMSGLTIQTSGSGCYEYYDPVNKCLKFIFT